MIKYLYGNELSGYIKERQSKTVRTLLNNKIKPKLAIIKTIDDPIINLYIKLKQKYAEDLNINVDTFEIEQKQISKLIQDLNDDASVQGLIIQLPLEDPSQTDQIINLVDPNKDVDSLSTKSKYSPATPMAILWLLAGYNISLENKHILIIGQGKLVGAPLQKMMINSGLNVEVANKKTLSLKEQCLNADIIISATGSPGVLKSNMVASGTVVIDAGLAEEDGKTHGDVGDEVLEIMRKSPWGQDLKVIILTNMGEQEIPESVKKNNVSAVILKANMTPRQVFDLVNKIVSEEN